eukprot:5129174-Prymnesium_polylepis.1
MQHIVLAGVMADAAMLDAAIEAHACLCLLVRKETNVFVDARAGAHTRTRVRDGKSVQWIMRT